VPIGSLVDAASHAAAERAPSCFQVPEASKAAVARVTAAWKRSSSRCRTWMVSPSARRVGSVSINSSMALPSWLVTWSTGIASPWAQRTSQEGEATPTIVVPPYPNRCSSVKCRAAERTLGDVATPVGPAPRDPNDPDLWDWSGDDDDDVPTRSRHPVLALVAAVVVVAMVLAIVVAGL